MPAGAVLQDEYWLRRSRVAAALSTNWEQILAACPAVKEAAEDLEDLVQANPKTTFLIFRAEDCRSKGTVNDRLVFR